MASTSATVASVTATESQGVTVAAGSMGAESPVSRQPSAVSFSAAATFGPEEGTGSSVSYGPGDECVAPATVRINS